MALAKGVVDLHHDGAQAVVSAVAIPKAHRFEGIAQHPWVAMQPHLAVGIVDAFLRQQVEQPGQGPALSSAAPVAMVGVVKADGGAPVDRQSTAAMGLQVAHGQHQKISGVGKGMGFGFQARVAHLTKPKHRADNGWGCPCQVHGPTRLTPEPARFKMPRAAAWPARKPSSWKP